MRSIKRIAFLSVLVGTVVLIAHCGVGGSGSDASGSTSEAAVGAVGGAINSTSGDAVALNQFQPRKGNFEQRLRQWLTPETDSWAFATCPTVVTPGSGCSVVGKAITLTLSACVYNGRYAIWNGSTILTTAGSSTPACGTFPQLNGTTVTSITRTYGGNILSNPTTRTNDLGAQTVAIDTSASSSLTFSSAATASPTSGTIGWQYNVATPGGYQRTYVSPSSHTLSITVRTVGYHGSTTAGKVEFDHTLSTTDISGLPTPLVVSVVGSLHTVNGTLNLQHNLLKLTASSAFKDVVHDVSQHCCFPTGGTVTTSFSNGGNSGKSEILTFSAATCTLATLGQVGFTAVNGAKGTKTLTHCL